jgi:uncharacterized membrane protein YiaA
MGVLLNITKNLEPTMGFFIASMVVASFGIIYLFIVKEPNMRKLQASSHDLEDKGFIKKIAVLSVHVWNASK